MEDAHERYLGVFHYLHYFSLTALPVGLFLGHGNFHYVSVKGVPGLGSLDKDVVVLAVDNHKNESVPGHLNLSRQYAE